MGFISFRTRLSLVDRLTARPSNPAQCRESLLQRLVQSKKQHGENIPSGAVLRWLGMHKLPVGCLDFFSAEHKVYNTKQNISSVVAVIPRRRRQLREPRRTPNKKDEDMTEFGVGCGIRPRLKDDRYQLFQGLSIQKYDVINGSG